MALRPYKQLSVLSTLGLWENTGAVRPRPTEWLVNADEETRRRGQKGEISVKEGIFSRYSLGISSQYFPHPGTVRSSFLILTTCFLSHYFLSFLNNIERR